MPSQHNAQNREIDAYSDYRLQEGHIRSGAIDSVPPNPNTSLDRGAKPHSYREKSSRIAAPKTSMFAQTGRKKMVVPGALPEWQPPAAQLIHLRQFEGIQS
jgi:hypothetical protein